MSDPTREEQATRIYCLLIATTIRFERITPANLIDVAIKHVTSKDDSPPPVGLQPYLESVGLLRNIIKLSEYMDKIEIEDQILFKKIIETIGGMTEEEFIRFYKKRKQAK